MRTMGAQLCNTTVQDHSFISDRKSAPCSEGPERARVVLNRNNEKAFRYAIKTEYCDRDGGRGNIRYTGERGPRRMHVEGQQEPFRPLSPFTPPLPETLPCLLEGHAHLALPLAAPPPRGHRYR